MRSTVCYGSSGNILALKKRITGIQGGVGKKAVQRSHLLLYASQGV
jgi:hypothetical protein